MKAKLVISRSIAPPDQWNWMVIFDSGHIWDVSKESYDCAEICMMEAGTAGLISLYAAENL